MEPDYKAILKARQAGYERIARHDFEAAQRATASEKLRDVDILVSFARKYLREPSFEDQEIVREKWTRIKNRFSGEDN